MPVRIRLVTPLAVRKHFDGPKFAGYRSKTKGWLLTVRELPDQSPVFRGGESFGPHFDFKL